MTKMTQVARRTILPIAQELAESLGRATQAQRMLPQFLICGAQRCGTTSMYQALRQHPAVVRPTLRKGVHYFDVAYPNGLAWYRSHFPLLATARLRERQTGQRVLTFESSPYYLFHPMCAQRIATDLPGVKIVILVRDPCERAYSAYTHEFARGYETESFERAIELEPERTAGEQERLVADPGYRSHAHQHQAYVARGRYIDQIMRMTNALGRERVHVIDADEFFARPTAVWAELLDYLDLSSARPPVFKQHNARPRSEMSNSMRKHLEGVFQDSDERLASWWGRTPSWRR